MATETRPSQESDQSRFEEPLISIHSNNEVQPRKNIIRNICVFILVMELAERLCFYTFTSSIIVFLRDYLDYPQASAAALFSIFNTLVYLTPLIGGYVADSYWGRYKTIAVFGTIYMIGTALMAFSSIPNHEQKWLFMLAFFGLVTLGAGGIKSNVITMGGDQFNLDFIEESIQKDTYFIYFYWCINIGALVSYFLLAQMATDPAEFGLPRGSGFFVTFCASSGALAIALIVFFSATSRYIIKPATGSATANYCSLVYNAAFKNIKPNQNDLTISDYKMELKDQKYAQMLVCGVILLFIGIIIGIGQPFSPEGYIRDYLSYSAFGISILALFFVCYPTIGMPEWMNRRGNRSVMLATRIIPILLNTVSFQVVYAAMGYFSISACQMDVNLTIAKTTFQINGSMLNAADCLAIVFFVPLLDGFLYPMFNTCVGRKLKATEKYMFGMMVSILSIVFAAMFEIMRRNSSIVSGCGSNALENVPNNLNIPTPSPTQIVDDDNFFYNHQSCYSLCAASGVQMSNFSVWWMAIPFFLVGCGECLCNIPIYELCYSQTPPAYRSMAQAVFLFVTAIGSMLTGAFTTSLAKYIPDNLNDGHLEYLYYLCIIFCVLLLPINLYCFSLFEEIDEKEIEALVYIETTTPTTSEQTTKHHDRVRQSFTRDAKGEINPLRTSSALQDDEEEGGGGGKEEGNDEDNYNIDDDDDEEDGDEVGGVADGSGIMSILCELTNLSTRSCFSRHP
mmetsp:Transcript_43458/g.55812  ORF Transcript_43458/g.55812 Transcript_43458/m.55812 type:complete len:736 (-) Transcript_43458:826-3033(-)